MHTFLPVAPRVFTSHGIQWWRRTRYPHPHTASSATTAATDTPTTSIMVSTHFPKEKMLRIKQFLHLFLQLQRYMIHCFQQTIILNNFTSNPFSQYIINPFISFI
ncbi:hypothetical protein HanRHA438_Chr01g0042111 [Helianthus annuus]|nr:hypothetical protein HanRHA438_Chr01g0042111 [Helianthus annuus]